MHQPAFVQQELLDKPNYQADGAYDPEHWEVLFFFLENLNRITKSETSARDRPHWKMHGAQARMGRITRDQKYA